MPSPRVSLSITPELDEILRQVAQRMRIDQSRLVETLLRENPLIHRRSPSGAGVSLERNDDEMSLSFWFWAALQRSSGMNACEAGKSEFPTIAAD